MRRIAIVAGIVISLIAMTITGCVFTPGLDRIQRLVESIGGRGKDR